MPCSMSITFRAFVSALLLLVPACEREQRQFQVPAAAASSPAPERTRYEENAYAVSQGKMLFRWFNCNGCHAAGGGGMGPALMDAAWIYGSEPQNTYTTIVEGRENGMPAFGGKIPDQQIWQLVAYVRSMSAQLRFDVRPGRDDHMRVKESELARRPERPR
jgi:cytochrome c oxidase cbb3-type subunit 3